MKLTSYAFISGQKSIVNAQNSAAQKNYEKFFHILHADFVTTDSGTGIVHEAPAFGADDYDLVASHL